MEILHAVLQINQTAQMVYPDVLRRIIIINPPGIFSAIFAMCKPFLMQRLIDKIIVVSGDAYAALKEQYGGLARGKRGVQSSHVYPLVHTPCLASQTSTSPRCTAEKPPTPIPPAMRS